MVSLATTRFDDGSGDLPGFWGPVTSTIDWCEHNYVVTYYVAEFWNTVRLFVYVGSPVILRRACLDCILRIKRPD